MSEYSICSIQFIGSKFHFQENSDKSVIFSLQCQHIFKHRCKERIYLSATTATHLKEDELPGSAKLKINVIIDKLTK